ncbi:DNA polymerase III subunit delta' [Devosia pacifica]|uniref:DNA polymerase III subunit delta n=1 Tax=Devosia pacifica TaxID=1335967 RepID=A0A918RU36_9HYPH|nr:AAA family ATPase [Devosia pacifica]GHA11914.1 DNA polymerase III subunit delta' [Devosia pacifica]
MNDPDALEDVSLPEESPGVIGHDEARAIVSQRLNGGTLPGAIMLHGPRGIGKATLAFAIAQDLLVATGDEDAHRVQEQILAGAHPNIQVLRRQQRDARAYYTVIRIEDIRSLRDSLHMTRGRNGHRIAIIDTIDDCNISAANALLKTLEEPPAQTMFILVSHRPGQLLPTIRSRCHSIALRPISDDDVAQVLRQQRPDLPDQQVQGAVSMAQGRPRRAFEALTIGGESALGGLSGWLARPLDHDSGAHLALADQLAAKAQSPELMFARDMMLEWLAVEAREAATQHAGKRRLASVNQLWEKAQAAFAEADALNLDMRQTLVTVLDDIRLHARSFLAAEIQ